MIYGDSKWYFLPPKRAIWQNFPQEHGALGTTTPYLCYCGRSLGAVTWKQQRGGGVSQHVGALDVPLEVRING